MFIEQDINKEAHIRRAMPLFLTLRDQDGNCAGHGDAAARRARGSGGCIIVGPGNADPYPEHGDAIAALGAPFRNDPRPEQLLPLSSLIAGGFVMAITLEKFAADCHDALKAQPGTPGREKVRELVEQALADPEFVATYIPPGTPERHLLYEDPGTGLCDPGARLYRAEGQQAARSRPVLGDLRPGRRRNDHDRLGLRGAPDRQRAGQGRVQSTTT